MTVGDHYVILLGFIYWFFLCVSLSDMKVYLCIYLLLPSDNPNSNNTNRETPRLTVSSCHLTNRLTYSIYRVYACVFLFLLGSMKGLLGFLPIDTLHDTV
nr:MAG TPA: hypothetical protein [Caudoviricetes sp.]